MWDVLSSKDDDSPVPNELSALSGELGTELEPPLDEIGAILIDP